MAQNKNRIEIPQDRNSYLGTLNRTWIDKVNKKVGRYFPEEKYEQIVYIHKLSRELAANDIPVQRPLCEPVPVNNLIVAYYQYCKNDPGDFKDGWYVPEETPERIANAAKTFAEFQKLAKNLRGPEKPLDYPYCNSLDWILEPSPLEKLLGEIYIKYKANKEYRNKSIKEYEKMVADLIDKAIPIIEESAWGLCHGDFHSGNTIFQGEEIKLIVDFDFWVHHPLIFDLAISLEMWGRDWDSKKFALDYDKFNHFLDVYIQHGGPVKPLESLVYMLPLARLWIINYGIRKLKYPTDLDKFYKYINGAIMDRLYWYEENIGDLLKSSGLL
ncbi:MAG TPA: aminoglycoside phosphotransferase family protein [Halanaerobiales bacterium]|mgnify:FL=1|nr:aminoglycoside phosphotransferase family protein [Halanaerobiales bacterium]HPZ62605.1 aminoglycoside phosphotransferase family protein [Halanaerobiales bacterium]HQD03874.1 aminoglycoside phosphotransferase family protein [Halanaerobiales bacterium]